MNSTCHTWDNRNHTWETLHLTFLNASTKPSHQGWTSKLPADLEMVLANVLTCRLKDTRGVSGEIRPRRVMSFMNDFTPAQSEALSLHSVTLSTLFSFPLESNVYCVFSVAHFLTCSHVASLWLNCGWLIERIILLCVFGMKGCFQAQPKLFGLC